MPQHVDFVFVNHIFYTILISPMGKTMKPQAALGFTSIRRLVSAIP
jgi:hypothetical protein